MTKAVQFGAGSIRLGSVIVGHFQGGSVEFAFDDAELHSGNALFPVDVRVHTGHISGTIRWANIDTKTIEKALGGTLTGSKVTINNVSEPPEFVLDALLTTDTNTFRLVLYCCRSTGLSFDWSRTDHVIPEMPFKAYANTNGDVGYLDPTVIS